MKKSKFEELRGAREEKESRLRAYKLPLALVLVVVVLAVVGYVTPLMNRDRDMTEQKQCDDYCMTNYNQKGVLVPIITNQRTRPGASMGPFKCTCPR